MSNDRLISAEQVMDRIGLKRTALYAAIRDGRFPRPLRVGVRATRWPESQIEDWIASRPLAASGPEDQNTSRLAEPSHYCKKRTP